MLFLRKLLIIVATFILFLGCESKESYDIDSDKAIGDMSIRIKSLEEDLNTLTTELKEVKAVLNDKDIDIELRKSIRKEVHEGENHEKVRHRSDAYLKVQRKQRYKSLLNRKMDKSLKSKAEKEVADYFQQKKLKPIKKPWLKRYRTAIEL